VSTEEGVGTIFSLILPVLQAVPQSTDSSLLESSLEEEHEGGASTPVVPETYREATFEE
jgi:hypothetical protein